jgi:hypothetical protein
MKITERRLRSIIQEEMAGQERPLGGVREGGDFVPGHPSRGKMLTKRSTVTDRMFDLAMGLRQLYIDALDAHEQGDMDTYAALKGQIADTERQLTTLQRQHDEMSRELDRR